MEKTKILYVEDEVFLGKIVSESLESRGYDVKWVEDGNSFNDAFIEFNPDICVLDIMLPNKDGYQLSREVRKTHPNMPIIFLTAKNQTEDTLKGFKSGGNDYIKKPFSMEELIVRVENLLKLSANGTGTSAGSELAIGAFVFKPQALELVDPEGHIRQLSHRESQLIQHLFNGRNGIISRKEMLLQIWGDDSFFNSRNLDVYIKKLRDYLKPDPNIRIVTLKGVGYRFNF